MIADINPHNNKKNGTLISVIVPVYNVRDYVANCIESIQSQTYNNLEIILVDDGSEDGSGEICDRYSEKDSRIITLHKENGGLSDARNHALDRIHGEMVSFVDGDDLIHPQMIEVLYKMLVGTDYLLSACMFCRNKERLDFDVKSDFELQIIDKDTAVSFPEIPLVTAWNKLYRKDVFDDIRYPVGKFHEDEYVFHRIMWKCDKGIAITQMELYCYVERGESIMGNISKKRIDDALEALGERIEFAIGHNWDVVRALKERYLQYCVDTYMCLKNGRYSNYEKEWLDTLYGAEKEMLSKYMNVKVDKKYSVFKRDPQKYEEKYFERSEGIITGYFSRLKNKLKRIAEER